MKTYGLAANVFDNIGKTLSNPFVIWGIVLAVIGITMAFLARRITQTAKKVDEISKNDSLFITLRAVGLFLIIAAIILVVVIKDMKF